MPAHNHSTQSTLRAVNGAGTTNSPTGNSPAAPVDSRGNPLNIYSNGLPDVSLGAASSQVVAGIAGGSQPHNNMQPYLGMNYIICLEGIFPSRN
jgi:microcystin-dependent protein